MCFFFARHKCCARIELAPALDGAQFSKAAACCEPEGKLVESRHRNAPEVWAVPVIIWRQ